MGFLLTLLILTLTIVIHEYGHYRTMRRNGVKVLTFAIGFGPSLWETRLKSGTVFAIKMLPFGGYVMPTNEEGQGMVSEKSKWVQFKIYMAGMFMNSIAAFIVALGVMYYMGGVFTKIAPLVEWAPIWARIPVAAFMASFGLWLITPAFIVYLIATQGAQIKNSLMGPIGIVDMGNTVVEQSETFADLVLSQVMFFYMINVAIAGMNLVPVPPLDGGHVFVLLLKKFGVSQKVIGYYSKAGMIAFLLLIVAVFYFDIMRVFFPT